MKILVTSDWHLDARTAGVERFDELEAYVEKLIAVSVDMDLVVHLGDFYDPGAKLAPRYTALMLDSFNTLCESSKVIVLAGNHDVIETSRRLTTITPLKVLPIEVVEFPRYIVGVTTDVLALPYEARSSAIEADTIRAFSEAAQRPKGRKLIVLSHLTVPGATLGSESKEMSRGRDIDFPFEKVAALNPDLILQGHYHRRQVVKVKGCEIVIPGSPIRVTFGERNDGEKGFTVVEL